MRLQSLNCPNCGSPLRTANDVQICDSCGSTFKIDYDDSDVAYERVSKEDELNRQRFEHEKEMLETQYRLQEEARLRQAKFEKAEARKKRVAGRIGALITLLVMGLIFIGIPLFLYRYIKGRSIASAFNFPEATTTTETTVSPYLISGSDLLSDSEFIENAVASVFSEIRISRKGPVTTYDLPITDWYMIGGPEIYDCYLLTSEDGNQLCFLIKMSYQSERDEDDIQEVYDCLCFKNITVGKNGKIACDYSVFSDRGDGANDWLWDASLDSDQMYRTAILAKSEFDREKIDLPESVLTSPDSEEDVTDEDDESYDEDYDEDTDEDSEDDYEED